jgi:AraC-like DNA-binding protein
MPRSLLQLTQRLQPLVLGEGVRSTALSGVKLMYTQHHVARAPISYEPKIVIIAQGQKIGYFGSERIVYSAGSYLVLGAPLSFECETLGSKKKPLLGLSISLSPRLISSLLMQLKWSPPTNYHPPIMSATAITSDLLDATVRLAEALASPDEIRVLGAGLVQEIVFRALSGPLRDSILALAWPPAYYEPVLRAVQLMSSHYEQPHSVSALATSFGLSTSSFHQRFREIMKISPLQYLKQTRLHKARLFMVHDGLTASAAASRVGYQSSTQFSREFRHLFGGTPAEVARQLRHAEIRLEE